jgi:hypothetical protein
MGKRRYDKYYHPKTPWNDWGKEAQDGLEICIVCGRLTKTDKWRRCAECKVLIDQCGLKVVDIRKYSKREYKNSYKYMPYSEKYRQRNRSYNERFVQNLEDGYISKNLKYQGITPSPETIETYRGIIRLRRIVRSIKYITVNGLDYERCPSCGYYYHNLKFPGSHCTICHNSHQLNRYRKSVGKELLTEEEELSRRVSWLDKHPEVKILQL